MRLRAEAAGHVGHFSPHVQPLQSFRQGLLWNSTGHFARHGEQPFLRISDHNHPYFNSFENIS